ncbi:MAG: hypothetical protein RIS94_1128 [Pseudomonadota bacterium]|jgi:AraC-like DNA-binding protein
MPLPETGRAAITLGEVVDLLRRAERAGADPLQILRRARVPHSMEDLSGERPALIAQRHLVAIYRECVIGVGWHSSRQDGKPQMHPREFRLMCHCVITSPTLRKVIERQIVFFETRVERLSAMRLIERDGTATVEVDTLRRRRTFGAFLSDLVGMAAFSRLYAWLLGIGEDSFAVELAHSARHAHDALNEISGGRLRFDCPINTIAFPAPLLDRPLMRSPAELEKLLEQFPFDFLSRRLAAMALRDRVRSLYVRSLNRGEPLPSLEAIAAEAGQSVSTVRRQLATEGASVRALRDEARRDVALGLLQHDAPKVEDLAQRLGFRDIDSFRAAFRRWTGTTPSRLRGA